MSRNSQQQLLVQTSARQELPLPCRDDLALAGLCSLRLSWNRSLGISSTRGIFLSFGAENQTLKLLLH